MKTPRELQFDRGMEYYMSVFHEIRYNPSISWRSKLLMLDDLIKMTPKLKQHILYFINVYDKPT